MRVPLSRIPLLPAAIGMAVGILFATWWGAYVMVWCIVSAVAAGVLIWRREWWAAMIALAAVPGAISATLHDRELTYPLSGEWQGEIIDTSQTDRVSALEVEVSSWRSEDTDEGGEWRDVAPFTVRIIVPAPDSVYLPGQQIQFNATFTPLSTETDLPYQASESDRLRQRGYTATTLVTQEDITSTGRYGWRTGVAEVRTRLTDILLRAPMQSRTKEFLTAAMFGYRHLLSPDTLKDFDRGGVSHVLAISGLHVGILIWILSLLLWPVRLLSRRTSTLLIIGIIWLYALLTGFAPSVTRAVVMVSMVLAGRLMHRTSSTFNSLLLAFIVILLVSPQALFSIGFQMSFCAVASILLFTPHLNRISPRQRIRFFIGNTLTATLAAMLAVGIISAYYFHTFPLLFLLSNLVLAILLPLMLTCGAGIIILTLFGASTAWLCNIADILYGLNDTYLHLLSGMPFVALSDLYFPVWVIALWLAGLVTLKLRFVTHRRVYCYSTAVLLIGSIVIVLLPHNERSCDESAHVYFQRQRMVTTLIIERPDDSNGRSIEIMTSAPRHSREQLLIDFKENNREWITRHSIRNIRLTDRDTVTADNLRLILIHKGKTARHHEGRFTHAVICRGFSGTLEDVRDSLSFDTLILSYDMHPRVYCRLKHEADELGLPYVSLKDAPYSMKSGE